MERSTSPSPLGKAQRNGSANNGLTIFTGVDTLNKDHPVAQAA
ncbi:MAG: hypothetical protein V4658_07105 [Bacteroidota bacterium]